MSDDNGDQRAEIEEDPKNPTSPEAQWFLGHQYYQGWEGTPQDFTEAEKWFRRSALQGHQMAQASLGQMYLRGEGVEVDYKESARWWRYAAEQGMAIAQHRMGVLHLSGLIGEQDQKSAYMWLNLAAAGDDEEIASKARILRTELEGEMTRSDLEEAQRLSREWTPKQVSELGLSSDNALDRSSKEEAEAASSELAPTIQGDTQEDTTETAATDSTHEKEMEGLSVPQWFPPDDTTKATLNNFGGIPERQRFSHNRSLPASRSLCEVYIRGYLFPNAYLAFADADYPELLRKVEANQSLTNNMLRMTHVLNTGAFDRNENEDPRWHPDEDLPSLTRRQIYEKYYGLSISDELIEATENKTMKAWSKGQRDQGLLTVDDDAPISESEIRVFLESFDKFKNDYLRSKNALPPGTYIWEPWMRKFHENFPSEKNSEPGDSAVMSTSGNALPLKEATAKNLNDDPIIGEWALRLRSNRATIWRFNRDGSWIRPGGPGFGEMKGRWEREGDVVLAWRHDPNNRYKTDPSKPLAEVHIDMDKGELFWKPLQGVLSFRGHRRSEAR